MFEPEKFHVTETLHDGGTVEIRAQKPEDREEILALVEHASAETLYHRFFAMKRSFSEKEQHFFFDIDFVNHVVLIAVAKTDERQPNRRGSPLRRHRTGQGRSVVLGRRRVSGPRPRRL